MSAAREQRNHIGYATLVVSVKHDHMSEPIRTRVGEGGLVRAPQVVVLPVACDGDTELTQLVQVVDCDLNRSVGATVIQNENFLEQACRHVAELVENATDLRYLLTRYPPDVVRRAITQSQAVLSAEAGVRDPFPEPER